MAKNKIILVFQFLIGKVQLIKMTATLAKVRVVSIPYK